MVRTAKTELKELLVCKDFKASEASKAIKVLMVRTAKMVRRVCKDFKAIKATKVLMVLMETMATTAKTVRRACKDFKASVACRATKAQWAYKAHSRQTQPLNCNLSLRTILW